LTRPTADLHLATDPRIPDSLERFTFEIETPFRPRRVEWIVDGRVVGTTGPDERRWPWRLVRGEHAAQARVWESLDRDPELTSAVPFTVK
jgi:hypothetical protein